MSIAAPNTLADIRAKVRRLTGSPSTNQISDQTVDQYINTFYFYDFPEHLKTFTLKTTYVFYTTPGQDSYDFPREMYRELMPPVYIAGYRVFYSQSREQFYAVWPQLEFNELLVTGNGTAGPYTIQTSNPPFLPGYTWQTNSQLVPQVIVSSVNAAGAAVIAADNGTGGFVDPNNNNAPLVGTVNYQTGLISGLVFGQSIASGASIATQYIPQVPSRPMAMLFYGDKFFLRPVPDQTYKVQMDVFVFPTQFINDNSVSALTEWWQYIAYGAALKILTDRLDVDGVQRIMPFFKEQQQLTIRRSIVQQTNERTMTIYSDQHDGQGFNNNFAGNR
jgi:hypothetical protein